MNSEFNIWKKAILNQTIAIHREYGDDALPIVEAAAKWAKKQKIETKVPPFFRRNFDYGEKGSLNNLLDEYRKEQEKKLKKAAYEAYAISLNAEKPGSKALAVREFLKYISEVAG